MIRSRLFISDSSKHPWHPFDFVYNYLMSNEYRLHIDIPMGLDEGNALKSSEAILALLQGLVETGQKVQYRLGNDEDRQSSNYFQKNENGHVSNKKCKIQLGNDSSAVPNIQVDDGLTAVDDVV